MFLKYFTLSQHVLSLEAPDTLNRCQLRLVDTSVYNTQVNVTCPDLQVTVPGFNIAVDIPVQPGFILNLTACDLKIQKNGCGTTFDNLPDGIYIIRYSVAPNKFVYVEYNYLRETNALNKVYKILCSLDVSHCEPPAKVKAKLEELNLIRMYLLAAKAKVEYCHKPKEGMDIFNYAVRLLDKMTCSTCV